MWPNYKSGDVQLSHDDIKGIQYLYGGKRYTPTRRPTYTEQPEMPYTPVDGNQPSGGNYPNICDDASIDAAVEIGQETFFFKGDYYWKIVNYRREGQPERIQNRWKELSGSIDAILQDDDRTIYFFKNDKCWKYDFNNNLIQGYPKEIDDDFADIPDNLDAALTWKNGDLYFFKGKSTL